MTSLAPAFFRIVPSSILFALAVLVAILSHGNVAAESQSGVSQEHPWGTIETHQDTLKITVTSPPPSNRITIPRLNNRLKTIVLEEAPDTKIKFTPEPTVWLITLPKATKYPATIRLTTIEPVRFCEKPFVVTANKSGIVELPAHHVITHGQKLRFEPQAHKNTVGYWTKENDWAEWYLEIKQPSLFQCEVLQGCGKGQGGSEVNLTFVSIDNQDPQKRSISFTVKDTGHFQNFVPREIGNVELLAGRYRLEVRPTKLAAKAIGDIRQIKLTPVGN